MYELLVCCLQVCNFTLSDKIFFIFNRFRYCFVQNLRDEGLMEDPQYSVLSEWFNFSMTNLPIKVDLIGMLPISCM